ncbi:unnamed protein product [Gadus morhua 'NCC']
MEVDQHIIVAVCGRPVLYDTTMVSYRDRNKTERAWVDVAEDIGVPVDVCRRRWKSLRDRYMRYKRNEKEGKRAGQRQGEWTRGDLLGSCPSSTPLSPRGRPAAIYLWGQRRLRGTGLRKLHCQGQEKMRSLSRQQHRTIQTSPAAAPAPRPQGATKRKRAARVPEGNNVQTAILQALQRHNSVPTPTPLSGNEHFAMGLVPSLDRLPPEVLEYVKFQIRKVIFDQSNFTVQLEPI